MLAAEPPSTTTTATSPHLGHRKPLQPKQNIFNFTNTNLYDAPPKPNSTTKTKTTHYQPPFPFEFTPPIINHPNKENMNVNTNKDIQLMDASLAEELTAVKRKLERLKSDKDKTRELLQQRDRVLEVQMTELLDRGQFQKELEIEVDRLYRLKHLKLACLRKSPIKSLRERQMEKMNKNSQLDSEEKSGESKEESMDESSTTASPTVSYGSLSVSVSASASTATRSTTTSKMLPISLRLSLQTDLDNN